MSACGRDDLCADEARHADRMAAHGAEQADHRERGRGGSEDAPTLVAELFRGAGVTTLIAADIHRAVWTKLMTNATFNTLCALTRCAPMRCRQGTRISGRSRVKSLREIEALAIASAAASKARWKTHFQAAYEKGLFKPSTLQDLEAGRPLEVAALVDARSSSRSATAFRCRRCASPVRR